MIDALNTTSHGHRLESIVASFLRHHPRAHEVRAAWDAVRCFVDSTRVSAFKQPDAELLLLAKALDACRMQCEARRLAALTTCGAPLRGNLPLAELSVTTLCALATGVLRSVQDSTLVPGAVLVIDGCRLHGGAERELDFAVLPAFRALLVDALRILNAQSRPGLIIAKGWSSAVGSRREPAEDIFAHLAGPDSPHRLLWMD